MRRCLWPFVGLVILAFALRIHNIDRYDLWYDEAGQALAGFKLSIVETLHVARKHYGASPLSYLLTFITVRLAGASELALRFEPLLWSVLAVALTARTALALAPRSATWVGLLAAISPLAIRYAQEVRFYALGLMWASAVLCFVILVAKGAVRRTNLTWLGLFGLIVALLYSYVYAVFILIPAFIIAFLVAPSQERLRLTLWIISACIAAGILFAPWLLFGMKVAQHPFGAGTLSSSILRTVLAGLEVTPLSQQPSSSDMGSSLFADVILSLSALTVVYALWRVRRSSWLLGGVLGVGLAALAVCIANLSVGYFFQPRQFLFLQPVRALLLGATIAGIAASLPALLRVAMASGLVGLSILYTNADFHRIERARVRPAVQALVARLSRHYQAPVFIVPYWLHTTPEYYARTIGARIQWQQFPDDEVTQEGLEKTPSGTVVVVGGRRTDLDELLRSAGFSEAEQSPLPSPPSFRVWIKDAPNVP